MLAFFVIGFILGLFRFFHSVALAMVGVTGGLALGVRIVILRDRLLFHTVEKGAGGELDSGGGLLFALNWVLVALLGAFGMFVMIWPSWQRTAIVSGLFIIQFC